ncbi:MAG: hypothetical protein MJ168_05310 [Clostridia bacterium]|nr:hypothetical protein [Clostridia bacterium]
MYCTRCGKELPKGMETCPECDAKNVKNIINSNVLSENNTEVIGRIKKSFLNLKEAKSLFLTTEILLIFNIIISFFDMIDVSIIFSERSDSFYEFLKYLKEYDSDDAKVFLPILTICTVLTVISIFYTCIPILFDKKYSKKYLMLNYPTMILAFTVYLILIIAFSEEDTGGLGNIEVKFGAYLYLFETLCTFVSTIIFGHKIKSMK